MVGVMVVIATSFKRTYVSMLHLPGLLYSVFLTPQQVTVDTLLSQRLLDTHRQVWLGLLWGNISFHLSSGVHKVLYVPSKSLFPQQILKFNSGPRIGKGQFSLQSQRKVVPKNVQTTTQLHLFHMLAK